MYSVLCFLDDNESLHVKRKEVVNVFTQGTPEKRNYFSCTAANINSTQNINFKLIIDNSREEKGNAIFVEKNIKRLIT